MNPDDLLAIAYELMHRDPGRPKQASLKRAISTAYYALFHLVCDDFRKHVINWHVSPERYWDVVTPIYRSLDHGQMKRSFEALRKDAQATAELKQFARIFIDLQAARNSADYDPKPTLRRGSALQLVEQVREAMKIFSALPSGDRRGIVVSFLSKQR